MNEFKLLCDKIGGNWEDALHGLHPWKDWR